MSGMPYAGRGDKESEEQRSKPSPDYLRRRYEELSALDPITPPVIGGDAFDDRLPRPNHAGSDAERGR
jgi:hypothetical protein